MITAEEILARQLEAPFTPFKIHISNGRSIDIQHPEQMLVYQNSVVVAVRKEPGRLPERGEKVAIAHITSLEGVEAH
jgi:hypothetical protein